MELVSQGREVDAFGEMNAGTASDHWQLGWLHLRRSLQLTFGFGPRKPADGADVSVSPQPGELDDDGKPTNGVFLPTEGWKELWDLGILAFILYSAVMVPYRICFDSPAEGQWFILEQAITISFLVDVIFNFNTAFMHEERWVTNRREIALRYVSGWFWVDFPSAVPVELLDKYMEGDTSELGLLRFLRLFRLLRLLRLLKVGEYVAAIEIRFDLNLTFLRIAQMVLQLLFLAHMLGCFWFYVAAYVGIDMEITTWVSSYDDGRGVDAPPDVQYLYAVYWALTTLTTVGYGDITPTNDIERIYSLFALLLGALVFGYMLSSIGSLVTAIDRQAMLTEEKMDEVKEYMRCRKLPRDLVSRLRKYYTYFYNRKTAFDEGEILATLTPALRLEVVRHSLKHTIGKIPLFRDTLDPTFQVEVYPMFKPINASPREIIYYKGSRSDCLFFLLRGSIEVISGYDSRVLYRVSEGSHFGETVLTGRRRVATHRAATSCEMFIISSEDLETLFKERPAECKLMRESVLTEHLRKERMHNLTLRLVINKLGSSEQDRKQKAALQIQIAWGKHLDYSYFKKYNLEPSQYEPGSPAKGTPAKAPKQLQNRGLSLPMTPSPSARTAPAAALESRLDKIEEMLHSLVSQQTRSDRGLRSRS